MIHPDDADTQLEFQDSQLAWEPVPSQSVQGVEAPHDSQYVEEVVEETKQELRKAMPLKASKSSMDEEEKEQEPKEDAVTECEVKKEEVGTINI